MFQTLHAAPAATLDKLIERLSRHDLVDGILLMGSTAGTPTPDSDYDLLLVVRERPTALHLVFTTLNQRLTEVYVETTARIDKLIDDRQPVSSHAFDGALIEWLRTGQIAFDRHGRLQRAQGTLQQSERIAPPGDDDVYRTWFRINYNLLQTRRMLHARDPLYHMAVDVRLLYSLPEVLIGYFQARRLPWRGEKEALRYLQAHDQAFLDLWQQCLAAPDRAHKFALYEQLAVLSLVPVGGLWPDGATAVDFSAEANVRQETVETALAWWKDLVGEHGG